MVQFSRALQARKQWVDSLRIFVKGGHGSVYISPSSKVESLASVYTTNFIEKKQRLLAAQGDHASRSLVLGQPGKDIHLEVPTGIQVLDEGGRLLKDLDSEELTVRVAAGGNGGGPTNGWMGQPGVSRHIRLDLKIIADVGFVGFPNAGKSTLLRALSRAKPRIASYPFTTIKPNLGEIFYSKDGRKVLLADLPGLIEGASYNVGMGHRFLKHVERTRLLLFVVDINGFELRKGSTHRSPFQTIVLLNKELELYNADLIRKPCVLVVNKMDTPGSEEAYQELEERIGDFERSVEKHLHLGEEDEWSPPSKFMQFRRMVPISAKHSPKSVKVLKDSLREEMDLIDDACNPGLKSERDIRAALQNKWTHPELIIHTDMTVK
uniref:GTP-binding protein 10 n=1 Tax=Caligus rogercresseyi TaxID=217165 RepID=C1BRI6_CALRO|nr:GTP-binding protein 10 [Caligus rogercresseyi]